MLSLFALQAKDDVEVADDEAQDKGKGAAAKAVATERVYYGPRVKEGEHVFGIAHIYASFNDTFVVRHHTPRILARPPPPPLAPSSEDKATRGDR